MRATSLCIAAGVGLVLLACGDTTGPTAARPAAVAPDAGIAAGLSQSQPVSVVRGAPAVQIRHGSFWAVQGKESRFTAAFRGASAPGTPFLTLTIPSNTQLVAPGGRQLAPGDSMRITVAMVGRRLEAQFTPHGLAFDGVPARLVIDYTYADLRGLPETLLGIWYQPTKGAAWTKQNTVLDTGRKLAQADLSHFSAYAVRLSNYAVAY